MLEFGDEQGGRRCARRSCFPRDASVARLGALLLESAASVSREDDAMDFVSIRMISFGG
jgi:hypothetical protein